MKGTSSKVRKYKSIQKDRKAEYCYFKTQFKTKNNNKVESPNLETWIRQNYCVFKEKQIVQQQQKIRTILKLLSFLFLQSRIEFQKNIFRTKEQSQNGIHSFPFSFSSECLSKV